MTASLRTWLAEPLSRDVRASLERLRERDDVLAVAVMPDVHLAEEVCVGCVVATRSTLLPAAIGGDLGCGMTTQAFEGDGAALAVHSGSRALGPAIAAHHRARNGTPRGIWTVPGASAAADAFLGDLAFAVAWAQASRDAMLERAAVLLEHHLALRPLPATRFSCVHNLVRREEVDGAPAWVHRKGAIPAADGEPGIVPGSMGSATFHVEGRGCAEALRSSSHGAGRALPRGEARRTLRVRDFVRAMEGIGWDAARAPALLDEAPAAYKEIGRVMRAQRELTRIVRRLAPVLNWKGAT